MKRVPRAVVLAVCLAATAVRAQSPAADDPLLAQRRLATVLRQATKLYEAGEYNAVFERLDLLKGAAADDPGALNLRAAALTKLGRYDEADAIFRAILEANPNFFPAAFNLAELKFLRRDYAGALEMFLAMRRRDPRNELLRFRVMFSHLLLGNEDEARRRAKDLIPAGVTPAWYYAQAVLAKKDGDQRAAAKYLRAAHAIYGDGTCRIFDESLSSAGF